MAEYRPQPRSPIYKRPGHTYGRNRYGLFYHATCHPSPSMMIHNITQHLCENDPHWPGLSKKQFQQCEAELSGILQGEHQYGQIETANIALLGVLNVAITGGYRPTILGFQGNYLAYADYNQYGNTPETASGIDENKVSSQLGDSRELYGQANRSKAMSAINAGEYAEKVVSGLSLQEKLQATGIKPEVSRLNHMRLR